MKVLSVIIEKVTEAVKSGMVLPWTKPWRTQSPRNVISGKPYRGINYFMAMFFGGGESLFITFNQARNAGGFVKSGAKGLPIVFFKRIGKGTFNDNGIEDTFSMLRYFTVFALRDTEGLEHLRPVESEFVPVASCEAIAARIDAPITYGGNVAAYSPKEHAIFMPEQSAFNSTAHFYSTLFHEAIHATAKLVGHDLAKNGSMGSESYSKEELIAEMGAAMLANAAGIWDESLERKSVAYVANWLKRITTEPNILIGAAREAQKRVDFLLGVKTEQEATPEGD